MYVEHQSGTTQISQMFGLTCLIPSHANCMQHVLGCWDFISVSHTLPGLFVFSCT